MIKYFLSSTLLLASSSAYCVGFAEGTLIRVDGQAIPIEEVRVNDEIVSCAGPDCVIGKVSDVMEGFQQTVQIITEKNEVIVASVEQMFFIHDCWTKANQLKVGDLLETPEGHVEIVEVKSGYEEKVYTFEVEEFHTFFAYNALVHNPNHLGNGPYSQYQGIAHNAGEVSSATKEAVACFGESAAKGCYQGAAAGKLAGAKGWKTHALNCGRGAVVTLGETLLTGDCNQAQGATLGASHDFSGPSYDFNQSTFDQTGKLACSGGGCSTVEGANNEANGINSDNYGLVESVGNNTATSPAE